MPELLEYLLYFATATLPEIGVVLFSALTLLFCIDSYRVHRQDYAILRRNGADALAFRESAAQGRSAFGRGVIAAIFLFLGLVAVRTPALIPLIIAPLVSFVLLAVVVLILGVLQILDRRDRRANIRDLLALRRAREANAAGIIAIDRHSVILQFNAAAERIFGYAAGEVIGTSMTELMPERFRDDHLRGMARAYASDTPGSRMNQVLDLPGLRKDGSEVPLHISLGETKGIAGKVFVALFTEELPGADKLAKDIDELRHDAQMERFQENIDLTERTRLITQSAKEAAEAAANAAEQASEKIATANRLAGEAATSLEAYLRLTETKRDEHDQEREDRANARDEREQDRQDKRDDRRDERERNRG